MLQRLEGVTIAEAVEATSWRPHTVCRALAGALKVGDRGRAYRLG